jgi:hypothetical protein
MTPSRRPLLPAVRFEMVFKFVFALTIICAVGAVGGSAAYSYIIHNTAGETTVKDHDYELLRSNIESLGWAFKAGCLAIFGLLAYERFSAYRAEGEDGDE